MDLLEYQGKQLFARFGIPVPEGNVANTPEQAVEIADGVGYPTVIKAQVKIGGRGKAGGIKIANNAQEARANAEAILGMEIRGHTVHEAWVERASKIAKEYYASIVSDRSAKKPLLMLSSMGGVDIEEVAESNPEAIAKVHIDPLIGFQDCHGRLACYQAAIDEDVIRQTTQILGRLYQAFCGSDAMLVEVNPLIVTEERQVVALDSKVTVDENALYRQPEISALQDAEQDADPQEQMAREKGLTYVKLDGSVGILGNGAGLVMSTLDVVAQAGGQPANFLDVGGGAKAEMIVDSLQVILSDDKVKAVLFNIFGGITRCDEVANGILEALDKIEVKVPIVVRLDGTNDEEGRKILAEAAPEGIEVEATMLGAADRVVELAA